VPTSKQARSRQARQKERLAIAAVHKQSKRRRRRQVFAGIAVFVVIVLVFGVFVLGGTTHNDRVDITSPATNAPTNVPTSAAPASAKGKPCVARKGELPQGAPDVDVATGAPPTELVIKDLKEGTGAVVKAGDTVTAHYIGVACSTGKIFDSSWAQGQPATFPLGQVIKGWQDGLPGMKVGGRRLLGIPSELAYGPEARAPDIAPDEALWFVVDMTEATPTTQPSTPSS
jgi:peptidylprolyl isomerase